MSSRTLFGSRLVKNWKFQYNVFKSIADWTIMLYIMIPAMVIFISIYVSWWTENPAWIEGFPLFLLFLILYVSTWVGNIRTYMEEADKVILFKKVHLMWKLKKWGYGYSLLFQALTVLGSSLILLPFFLKQYQLGYHEIAGIIIYFTSLKAMLMLVKYHIRKAETQLIKVVKSVLVFIGLSWFSQLIFWMIQNGSLLPVYICSIIILFISVFLSLRSFKKISSLDIEIDMEKERKNSIIQLIFMAAPEIEKPVVSKRKKPFLFRNSKRIFKNRTPINGFIEAFIKIFIRNSSYISGYFVLINVTTAAIVIVPPIWIKVVIFLGFLIMMYIWISSVWDQVYSSHPFMKKYRGNNFYFSAKQRVVSSMYILAITLLLVFIAVGWTITSKIGL
ncbi:ABC transporter permease [Bacillus dakarensis]|uniref:ABC transporter permease n=1 Tax=Robertmurraya dakarensis TaxID=1926278 RepID=UPI00098145B3|nr:ABC transporter permease [Bacillus dakarensis]